MYVPYHYVGVVRMYITMSLVVIVVFENSNIQINSAFYLQPPLLFELPIFNIGNPPGNPTVMPVFPP